MRVLVASTAATGHFGPLVPFARALLDAGHEVAVAAPASFAAQVADAGLPHRPFDDPPADLMRATFAGLPRLTPEEADEVVVREVFGRLDARAALPGVRATINDWRPDLVLHEPAELGSLAAAEAASVPHAMVAIGTTRFAQVLTDRLVEPFAELDALAGLPTGRCGAAFAESPVLTSVPEALDTAVGEPLSTPVHRFRVDEASGAAELPPVWGDADAPLVYVTFGSVAAQLAPFRGIYAAAVAALADAPYRVLLTTGKALELADLGSPPDNVRVEQWWPQARVLPAADVVVGHGGFGTTMAAAAHGVPQVVLPLFSFDQHLNAEHLVAVGAGVRVDGGPAGVEHLSVAIAALLAEESYRAAARALAEEIHRLPPLSASVAVLEELGRKAAPAR